MKYFLCVFAFCSILTGALTKIVPAQAPATLDKQTRDQTIDSVLKLLRENYVFPETADRMEAHIRQLQKKGEYEKFADPLRFAEKITADLQSISRDIHLRLRYSEQILAPENPLSAGPSPEWLANLRRRLTRENFGLERVEILKGNIGLIQINYFASPIWAGETYTAALNTVANTDALIVDLRNNNGSMDENAVPFVCSYFFEDSVHLIDIHSRSDNQTRQFWTYAQVPGRKYLDKPIYVLTSNKTFSGAEDFAYDLQQLKRATIVGERTRGGANPGGTRRVGDHFSLWLPTQSAINPVTKTNWEQTGVAPDINVQTTKALNTAHLEALNRALQTAKDENWRKELQTVITEVEQKQKSFKPVVFELKGFSDANQVEVIGAFNFWSSRINKMTKTNTGWTASIELPAGQHAYQFMVDGKRIADPNGLRSVKTVE